MISVWHNLCNIIARTMKNLWNFRWKWALKRVKICELTNCSKNMMYITYNNVVNDCEWPEWSLKWNLFWETSKISMFFFAVRHCGTLYSKSVMLCKRLNITFGQLALRQLWSDGSLRVLTPRSCPSSMLRTWWFCNSVYFLSWKFEVFPEFWWRGYSQQNISCVTKL